MYKLGDKIRHKTMNMGNLLIVEKRCYEYKAKYISGLLNGQVKYIPIDTKAYLVVGNIFNDPPKNKRK